MPHRFAGLSPAALIALLAAVPAASFAQTTPTAQQVEGPAPADQVVQMEAFNVSTTIGSYHEEMSSMATKVPTSLKELASSLQVLNTNAISDRNAVTLQDVFQYVVGITQTQNNSNGFSFRGFPNSGTFTQNIETDGLMGGAMKKGAVSAANVESLEFLKGPNSVLYGQMKPGGLLNIVTKSPKATPEANFRITGSTWVGKYNNFGSKNGVTASMDVTGPITKEKHWLYRLVVDAESSPPFRKGDFDRTISVYPSITYRWKPGTYFTVKMETSQDYRRQDDQLVPIFTNGTAYGPNAKWYSAPLDTVYQDPTDVGRDRGSAVSSQFQARFFDNKWTARFQSRTVWHTDFVHEFTHNNTNVFVPAIGYATPTTTLRRQYNLVINGHRYNFFDANVFGTIGPKSFENTVIVGVGGGQEFVDNQRFAFGPNVNPPVTLINPILGQSAYPADGTAPQSQRNTLTNFGEYISDQIRLVQRFHISVGVRNDQQGSHAIDTFKPLTSPYTKQFVTAVTGQAGAVFDVTPDLSIYGSWSQSDVPNPVNQVDITGQSGFPPEKGLQWEEGLKYETPAKNLYAALAVYYIKRTNVLVATGLSLPVTGQGVFRLDGGQESKGIELETQWQPLPYWQVQAGVALSKAVITISTKNPQTIGLDLTGAPRGSANFWTRYNFPTGALKGFGLGSGIIYTGKQWAGDPSSVVYFSLPGWTRADVAAYYKWKRYNLALNVQNVFDRKYMSASQNAQVLYPGDERKVTLSVATHF